MDFDCRSNYFATEAICFFVIKIYVLYEKSFSERRQRRKRRFELGLQSLRYLRFLLFTLFSRVAADRLADQTRGLAGRAGFFRFRAGSDVVLESSRAKEIGPRLHVFSIRCWMFDVRRFVRQKRNRPSRTLN